MNRERPEKWDGDYEFIKWFFESGKADRRLDAVKIDYSDRWLRLSERGEAAP